MRQLERTAVRRASSLCVAPWRRAATKFFGQSIIVPGLDLEQIYRELLDDSACTLNRSSLEGEHRCVALDKYQLVDRQGEND